MSDEGSTGDDRRAEENRRHDSAEVSDEHRSGTDRRGGDDRRGHFVNLKIDDDARIRDIVQWLTDNADAGWSIGPGENEPSGSGVTSRVRFDDPDKLDEFVAWLNDL